MFTGSLDAHATELLALDITEIARRLGIGVSSVRIVPHPARR